jgi:hypothetical protein
MVAGSTYGNALPPHLAQLPVQPLPEALNVTHSGSHADAP